MTSSQSRNKRFDRWVGWGSRVRLQTSGRASGASREREREVLPCPGQRRSKRARSGAEAHQRHQTGNVAKRRSGDSVSGSYGVGGLGLAGRGRRHLPRGALRRRTRMRGNAATRPYERASPPASSVCGCRMAGRAPWVARVPMARSPPQGELGARRTSLRPKDERAVPSPRFDRSEAAKGAARSQHWSRRASVGLGKPNSQEVVAPAVLGHAPLRCPVRREACAARSVLGVAPSPRVPCSAHERRASVCPSPHCDRSEVAKRAAQW